MRASRPSSARRPTGPASRPASPEPLKGRTLVAASLFDRILIANRGEIAVRVIRACRKLGIEAVAVYSDADADAMHVRIADAAVRLGPAPSTESYLQQDKVIQAALDTGAQAIHPGYGFLSENAGFARKVIDAGLVFIGPGPEAMEKMGDKVSARAQAEAAGVPVAPGSEALRDAEDAIREAERIGLPVMLKAAAGGGGIGMRIVREPDEVSKQFEACQKQAKAAFGDDSVFMEKFIQRPRHIEVQVLADTHGNAIHLYERECSIQRRHQKLLEEAPSPALSQLEREEIGEKAVQLAKNVGYASAGTLEFLYEDGQFYFNEMNTRLQVEHPVTELITGIDLVEWQLRVAAGEELGIQQQDVQIHGHAMEARINAEDPRDGFRPCPGPVQSLRLPAGAGIRVDSGLRPGWTVPSAYDSMVMKLITHGEDREAAVARMRQALTDLHIQGFTTNQEFHARLMEEPDFLAGDLSTRYLEEHDLMHDAEHGAAERRLAAAIVAAIHGRPGGGLAGVRLDQQRPRIVRAGTTRDWGSA